jgi:hypothetical protein
MKISGSFFADPLLYERLHFSGAPYGMLSECRALAEVRVTHKRKQTRICKSALFLAGFEQVDHLGDAGGAGFGAPGALDPAQVTFAVKCRQRFEEGFSLGVGVESLHDIRSQGICLRAFWGKLYLDRVADFYTSVSAPGRTGGQKILTLCKAQRPTERMAVDRAGDMMAVFYSPNFIGIERQGDGDF